jgi:ferredoxin
MALWITDQCINCDVCEPVCPNQAIYPGQKLYHIAPERCTECVGHYSEPQCVEVCPVECIFVDPNFVESKENLLLKLQGLVQAAAQATDAAPALTNPESSRCVLP